MPLAGGDVPRHLTDGRYGRPCRNDHGERDRLIVVDDHVPEEADIHRVTARWRGPGSDLAEQVAAGRQEQRGQEEWQSPEQTHAPPFGRGR
jgi:hypothetical protein